MLLVVSVSKSCQNVPLLRYAKTLSSSSIRGFGAHADASDAANDSSKITSVFMVCIADYDLSDFGRCTSGTIKCLEKRRKWLACRSNTASVCVPQ